MKITTTAAVLATHSQLNRETAMLRKALTAGAIAVGGLAACGTPAIAATQPTASEAKAPARQAPAPAPKPSTPAPSTPLPDVPNASVYKYVAGFTGSQLSTWADTTAAYSIEAGSCLKANGASASVDASGNLDLHSTGADDSCAIALSPSAYLYGVIEYRLHVPNAGGKIANWPAAWLMGGSWDTSTYQELDAFEGNGGYDYSSYWTGSGAPKGYDVTGYSTGGSWDDGSSHCVGIPALSAAPTGASGWVTVDVVWTSSGFSVYNNGELYAQVHKSIATPMNIILDNTESPSVGLLPVGKPSDLLVSYVRVWQ